MIDTEPITAATCRRVAQDIVEADMFKKIYEEAMKGSTYLEYEVTDAEMREALMIKLQDVHGFSVGTTGEGLLQVCW